MAYKNAHKPLILQKKSLKQSMDKIQLALCHALEKNVEITKNYTVANCFRLNEHVTWLGTESKYR
jgi:hypothetical protein